MNYKTPLGYYEKAIEELKRTQVDLQIELENIKTLQADNASLKAELKSTQKELQNTKQRLEELENNTEQKIQDVQNGIADGSIVAKKAIMLRARDDEHWMQFKYLKNEKYDTFLVRNGDGTWYHSVRVGAADKLRD